LVGGTPPPAGRSTDNVGAFGLAKNHPFNDGNKRIALIASFLFVELNGFRVIATESDAYDTIYALAAGEIDESRLSEWFGQNMRRKRR
jgi:death-on-curing protein